MCQTVAVCDVRSAGACGVHTKQALNPGLVWPLLDQSGDLRVLMIEPRLVAEMVGAFDPQAALLSCVGANGGGSKGQADSLRRLLESVNRLISIGSTMALPVLLCPSQARYRVRRWVEPFAPKVTVQTPHEIPAEIRVRSIGTVG